MSTRLRNLSALVGGLVCALNFATVQAEESVFETRVYNLQPGAFRAAGIPEGTNRVQGVRSPVQNPLQDFLEECGVSFPEGASITHHDRLGVLTIKNTLENLKAFERVLCKLNVLLSQVTIEARFLRMPRETAEDLFKPEVNLSKVSIVHEDVLRRIRELAKQKQITVLAQPKVTTVSGNTAQVKSVEEFRYPTEFGIAPPRVTTNSTNRITTMENIVLVPGGFETRELGTLLNVTPTLGPDGQTINLTLVPEISTKGEPNKIETTIPNGKVVVEQPRFRSRQVTTTVQILSGSTMLLGVADPVEGEDRDQIVLVLLTATVVYLQ